MHERVRDVVERSAALTVDVSSLDDDTDLYQAGMTSHASVRLMLTLEDEFDIEFPDAMLTRSTFESIASITRALEEIAVEGVDSRC